MRVKTWLAVALLLVCVSSAFAIHINLEDLFGGGGGGFFGGGAEPEAHGSDDSNAQPEMTSKCLGKNISRTIHVIHTLVNNIY